MMDDNIMEKAFDISPIRTPPQNIIYKLRDREIWGARKPNTNVHVVRKFYSNIFPNFTVINVEKPPCFLRKFSPDGAYFIAFSADQRSLEIYDYKGCSAAGDLLYTFKDEFVGNRYHFEIDNYIKRNIFDRFFRLRSVVHIEDGGHLNRECSLFTDDGKYVIVGSAAFVPDDVRPNYDDIYSSNEAVTPNSRVPLEDISIHLIHLSSGNLCDTLRFNFDKIYLSHNQGLYLYNDRFTVLSVQHQTIYVYLITDEMFLNIYVIGRYCYTNDPLIIGMVPPDPAHAGRPRYFREPLIGCLKHRVLVYLYKQFKDVYTETGNPYLLRKFYMHFDQYKEMKLWKLQMLDENHLLLKYASEEVVVMKATEPNAQPSLFVVYNMVTTEVIAVFDNTSSELLNLLEDHTDIFRNARLSVESQVTCSPANNVYARLALQRFKQTIISAKFGGETEAARRLLAQIPINAQSYSPSPYLDLSLYSYDDKWVSPMERPKACGEHAIKFFDRQSGLLKFRMYSSVYGRAIPAAKRLVAFIFHPTDPFAISVQRTNSDYVVNFHLRNVYGGGQT